MSRRSKNADADETVPDYGDMYRDSLLLDKCEMSRYLSTSHVEELGVFNQTLEKFIGDEDQRIASSYNGPPEDFEGWWIQDILGNHLRRAFVCASMDATAYHLNHLCQDVAVIVRQASPDLSREPITKAQVFLVQVGFDKSLSAV